LISGAYVEIGDASIASTAQIVFAHITHLSN